MRFVTQYDKFGRRVPGFNLRGNDVIRSKLGVVMTLICFIIVLVYALAKASHIQSVSGQTISTYYEAHDTSSDNSLYLNDLDFRIAFAIEDNLSTVSKHDPKYVRWVFRIQKTRNNVKSE